MRLMRHLGISAVAVGLALALMLLPASAADEVDQEVSALPPNGIQTWAALDALQQTFKPAQDTLTQVDLYLESFGAATTGAVTVSLEVKIVGMGTVVGNDVVVVPSGFDNGWISFDFPTVEVEPGTSYAIYVTVNDNTAGLAWAWNDDSYADGQGGTISGMILTLQDYDLMFQTYYEAAECGSILFGSTPPPGGGFGTFAFSCGTLDELVTASGCPEETATFFYNKPDGSFAVYIPGTEVGAVNAEFLGIFSGDPAFGEATIFTAKCV